MARPCFGRAELYSNHAGLELSQCFRPRFHTKNRLEQEPIEDERMTNQSEWNGENRAVDIPSIDSRGAGANRMPRTGFARAILLSAAMFVSFQAAAQSGPGEGLENLDQALFSNDVERRAAAANQATFNILDVACNPGGVLDRQLDPSGPPQGADPQCNGDVFNVYLTIRELVHTANELLGVGPTIASLALDQEGLGTVLRWTAAEELAAQGAAATEFSNGQLSNLASRMNALRFGARGFNLSGFNYRGGTDETMVAGSAPRQRGGGASADDSNRETYSPWGGFLSGSYGYGDKNDTDLENAFDFDGSEGSLGIDYRFTNNFVLGVLVGWSEQAIDFDEAASDIRVVDGSIESEGSSFIAFGMWSGERLFVSGSVGMQSLDYDVDRRIKYGSNNPNIGSANSIARSSPEADVVTATFGLNYAFSKGRFTTEPYVNFELKDITIDAFQEERSRDAFDGSTDEDAFNLAIAEQSFKSLDGSAGLKFQYTFTPQFGVIVPYARIEAHKEFENKSRLILAGYGSLADTDLFSGSGLLQFAIPTDEIDDSYYTWSIGVSTVLRGGRQREFDGPIAGGLMAFLQFQSVEGLDNYSERIVSGGFRYEF